MYETQAMIPSMGMSRLPEEKQIGLMRELDKLGTQRRRLERELDEVMEKIRATSVEAYSAGVTGVRILELTGIGSRSLVTWAREAGLGPRKRRAKTDQSPHPSG